MLLVCACVVASCEAAFSTALVAEERSLASPLAVALASCCRAELRLGSWLAAFAACNSCCASCALCCGVILLNCAARFFRAALNWLLLPLASALPRAFRLGLLLLCSTALAD